MVKSLLTLLVYYVWITVSDGQVSDLNWHSLGIKDGLSETINAFVFKDSRGFVWISSISGLNRYDGSNVKVYMPDKTDPSTLLDENIQSPFFEDADQNMWFTTFNAIHKYNFTGDCFDQYQVMKNPETPLRGYYIFYLDPDQFLWLLVEFSMVYTFHIPTGQFEFKGELNYNSIRCFNVTDDAGYLKQILIRGRDWMGVDVVTVHADRSISFPRPIPEAASMNILGIRPIIPMGDSLLWILTPQALLKHNTVRHVITPFTYEGQLECMLQLNDSLLLLGTLSDGLKVFNTRQYKFIQQPGIAGPVNADGNLLKISNLYKDPDGTIWISSAGVGVRFAHPEKKKFNTIRFSDHGVLKRDITPLGMFEYKEGTILCFTEIDGAYLLKPSRSGMDITPFAPTSGITKTKATHVIRDTDGRFWISTYDGLFIYPDQQGELQRVTSTEIVAQSIASSGSGQIYLTPSTPGFYEGQYKNGAAEIKAVPAFANKVILPVLTDHKERIWLNLYFRQFGIYEPVTYSLIDTLPIEGLTLALHVSKDQQTIFISTYNGLFEINEATLQLKKIHSTQTGFPTNTVFSMLNDDEGMIWMSHTDGIAAFDPVTGITHAYDHEDGLPLSAYTRASCRDTSGYFYFGTTGGITIFHPDSVKEIQTKAVPQILSLQLNDKEPGIPVVCSRTGSTHLAAIEKLVLPYRQNTLSFTIHSMEYSAPEANRISYKMEGIDENFLEGNNGDRIRYPSMPPGSYRFVMQAYNSDGVLNPERRMLEIFIRSPYYKTWWFISLVALFSLTVIGYIFYLRFSKKLELQRVRLKLYENLHDDVGSRLTAIVLSAEDLERNENISHPQITSISQIARSIVGNMRRLVWAIDPENDRMTSIVQKITHDKSQLLKDQIDFSIEVDPGLRNVILPGEFRYQICSICNESFNNISKYADASRVSVVISRENKNILLTVEDNGKGFDPGAVKKNELTGSGYGLSNMHRRASRIGGSFRIISAPGQGTKTEFRFPFRG